MALKALSIGEIPRETKLDENGIPTYPFFWLAQTDSDAHVGLEIIRLAQRWPDETQRVPLQGDFYRFGTFADRTVQLGAITARLLDPKNPYVWVIEGEYKAGDTNSKEDKERRRKPNPLDWDAKYTVEWVEENVPLEKARCMTALPTILRGPGFEQLDSNGKIPLGPIVNAAGSQTIEPIMVVVRHPILISKKNYRFTINSLRIMSEFTDTFNELEFIGDAPRTWKFLSCTAGDPQEKEVDDLGTIKWVPTVTKIEYNPLTWDKFILNNGNTRVRISYITGQGNQIILDPRGAPKTATNPGTPLLFPTVVVVPKSTFVFGTSDEPSSQPTINDFEEQESQEPMNLRPDGTQCMTVPRKDGLKPKFDMPDEQANHIQYRYLTEKDYNVLDPFKELVKQYNEYKAYNGL